MAEKKLEGKAALITGTDIPIDGGWCAR